MDWSRQKKKKVRNLGWSIYRRRARRRPYGRVDRSNVLIIKDEIGIVVELEEWR